MPTPPEHAADIEAVLSHRHDNGGELWATPDKRLLKGAPFSSLECPMFLLELGMPPDAPVLRQVAELFFSTWREDGRFKLSPSGGIYPCHTAHAAELMCRLGYAEDSRVQKTLRHLLDIHHSDGGLRCNKFSFGHGPETEHSNPFPTLVALSAFRHSAAFAGEAALDGMVDFLLWHWRERKPAGPCHYGMGTLFMQIEYPFRGYNLFYYIYVLSHCARARKDPRFLEALAALTARTVDGQVVVERVVPKLAGLNFCKKGRPSALATRRYEEILANMNKDA